MRRALAGDPSVALLRRNPSYRAYWAGQSISAVGGEVTVFVLPLVAALTLQAGPAQVGLVASAGTLPYLLFSLLAGHWLQGRDEKLVMIPADLCRAGVLLLVPVAWLGGWLSIPLLAGVAFISGCASLAFGVSAFAYTPRLVPREELAAANRTAQGATTVAEIGGPGLAGALVSLLGPPLAVALDAISYLASAIGIARSTPGPRASDEAAPRQGRLLAGLRILFTNPYLRSLTVHAALYNLASEIFAINLVLWAVKQQGLGAGAFGLALSAGGVGGLLGTLTALRLSDRLGFGRAFAASLALSCGVPLLTAAQDLRGAALGILIAVVMLVAGIGLGNANVYSLTLRQSVIPPGELTRSAGAYTQVMYGSIPIGAALAGLIGALAGTRTGVMVGAAGMALSALPMLTGRLLRLKETGQALATGPDEPNPVS